MIPRIHVSLAGMDGPRERQTGCWVSSCGHFRMDDHEAPQRTRDDFLLMYVIEGSGWIDTRGQRWVASPGSLIACFPHVRHRFHCDPTGWEVRWVHFQGDVAQRLMGLTALRPDRPVIGSALDQALVGRFAQVFDTLRAGGPFAALQASARLYDLLVDCATRLLAEEAEQHALLAAVASAPDSVDEMARSAGLSRFHFSRRFKEAVGISPWHYVSLLRLTRAKQLLADTDWPVKRIARELGFGDPDYFSRFFKQEVGQTARAYRAQAAARAR
jgi:AraC-like DNA-binding protein